MLLHGLLIWFAICVLAVINGGFREAVLRTRLGDRAADLTSPLILSTAILVGTWNTLSWIGPENLGQAWLLGGMWLALTLGFEFLAGHYLFGNPWEKVVGDYRVWRGRMWPMVPAILVFAPALAFVGMQPEHALPYAISNAVAVASLGLAFWRPVVARIVIGLIFAYAAIYNAQLALRNPEAYQGFADLALVPFYRDFITGWFRENAREMLLVIAFGQAIAAVGMLVPKWLGVGALGVTVFLMAIAPLGVGSAFPFSVLLSLAAVYLWGQNRWLQQR